jgi:CubicO group peptidase (beta-lactamase class C family)
MKELILLIFFILIKNISIAQSIDSIQYILDSTYSSSPFFGNILITKNNKVLFEKSYGFADAVNKQPLTKDNSFQVASISKQFTAYGIMILKSKGLLDYDSSVCRYIPTFPYKNISVRHLLTHTSGLQIFGTTSDLIWTLPNQMATKMF